MYYDEAPCEVCGSQVRLRARDDPQTGHGELGDGQAQGPVGPADGVVGGGDRTVDERVCLNPSCPTNAPAG